MYMQKGREMTVERIDELSVDLLNMTADFTVQRHHEFSEKLMEIVYYAREKAREDSLVDGIKEIQYTPAGMVAIREVPKCKNSAEDTLRESQIYIAGMMDASNVIWKHLDSCLDSIRNQNGEQLN